MDFRAEFHGDESAMGENVYGGLLFAQGLEAAQLDVQDGFLPTSFHSLFVSYREFRVLEIINELLTF